MDVDHTNPTLGYVGQEPDQWFGRGDLASGSATECSAVVGVTALGVAAFFAFYEPPVRSVRLRMTAGQEGGTRHRIAQVLQREAARRALAIELQAMAGSEKALEAVTSGQVDVALVQGGLGHGRPSGSPSGGGAAH